MSSGFDTLAEQDLHEEEEEIDFSGMWELLRCFFPLLTHIFRQISRLSMK